MDLYQALQAQAFLAVVDPDDEAWMRHVFREYSKRFATPLHQVPALPLEDVLVAYFEDTFEDLDDDGRDRMRELLLETDAEREARLAAESGKTDNSFYEQLNAEVAASMKPEPKKGDEPVQAPKGLEQLAARVKRIRKRAEQLAGTALPTVTAPKHPEPTQRADPTEVTIDFGDGNLGFDQDFDLDPLAPPSRKT